MSHVIGWYAKGVALLATLLLCIAQAATPVPQLRSPVTDLTNTLTPSQIASLDQTLRNFASTKGSQVAVLIVPTIGSESIEDFSIRVAETWKIGRANEDDGVIFVIAKDDRVMRIEVGYGLEGAIPDAVAKRIIRDTVTPHFRAGNFYLGIVAGTDQLMRAISGEALPPPSITERARRPGSDIGSIFPVLIILVLVVGGILRAIFGRFGGAALVSLATGAIVWFVIGTVVMAAIAAVIAFVITLLSGGGGLGSGRRYGRGWGGGGWGGGSSGGFGGWSGGGGGFGGGGASGRW